MLGTFSVVASEANGQGTSYDAGPCGTCHAKLTAGTNRHGLFIVGGCPDCHVPSDKPGKCQGAEPGKGFALLAPEPALCLGCHELQNKTPLHPAIQLGGCTICHDPHSNDNPLHLKVYPIMDLCYQCHDRKDQKKDVHTAVKEGRCVGCHNPHSGEEAPLLKKKKTEVCYNCHEPAKVLKDRFKHVPVAEGACLDCHDPHSSPYAKHTRGEGKDFCLGCHDPKARGGLDRPRGNKRIDLSKKVVHPALIYGECQDCHLPHSSPNRRLLQKPPPDLCYLCHDRKDSTTFVHGAVKMGDCPVCHNPHSEDQPRMLRQPPPIKNLCFQCHSDDITGRKVVHKPVAEGKCTECHSPHGSPDPFNIVRGDGKALCFSCHSAMRKACDPMVERCVYPTEEPKVKHKAIERYGCTACHDPHATDNPFRLIKPVVELCQSCHVDKPDGLHVTNFVQGGHRIKGGRDPHRTERPFTCVSCHNPHGSDNPRMFYFGKSRMDMCDWCHGDRTGANPQFKSLIHLNRVPTTTTSTGASP
ncbi:MAG: hypothetical protein HY791_36000 [Deltaproteobacteria bacterium]|nr:hypothetical protein [Deltaproteobacteria bacterium]